MKNEITTIQLRENVKKMLAGLREKSNEIYEEVIIKLVEAKNKDKAELDKLLKEQCEEMYEDDIKIAKEWYGTLLDGFDSYGY